MNIQRQGREGTKANVANQTEIFEYKNIFYLFSKQYQIKGLRIIT